MVFTAHEHCDAVSAAELRMASYAANVGESFAMICCTIFQ